MPCLGAVLKVFCTMVLRGDIPGSLEAFLAKAVLLSSLILKTLVRFLRILWIPSAAGWTVSLSAILPFMT